MSLRPPPGLLSGSQPGARGGIFVSMHTVFAPSIRPGAPRLLLLVLLIAALSLPVAGCGRKGPPEPPPGSDFPRTYPSR